MRNFYKIYYKLVDIFIGFAIGVLFCAIVEHL